MRVRASDVGEKLSRVHPDWLGPHKAVLLALMSTARDKEVRWHLAQTAPRLPLEAGERRACFALLFAWIDDPSRIVAAAALSALAELADDDPELRRKVMGLANALAGSLPPALRTRARIVTTRLGSRRP